MKKFPIAFLFSLIAIAVTLILFFTILADVDKETIHYVSLGGVLLAEVITAVYALLSQGYPRRTAATLVSLAMIPAAIVLGLIYTLAESEKIGTYIGWYSVLTLLVNAVAVALMLFDGTRNKEDAKVQALRGNVAVLRKMIKCVMLEPGAKPYEARLRKLDDDLHFTLATNFMQEDEQIHAMLVQLQTGINTEAAEEQVAALERAVQRRAIMVSRNP